MAKRCIICDAEAAYCIKGTSECYCQECATEHFGDITMLVKVEDEAQRLKSFIDERIGDDESSP
jgi:hypothetical protein